MPFIKRCVEPVEVSRSGNYGRPSNVPDELQYTTNIALSNLIRQLSSLSWQAHDIFRELSDEVSTVQQRSKRLTDRLQRLRVRCDALNADNDELAVRDVDIEKPFVSAQSGQQHLLARASLPQAVAHKYSTCVPPPALHRLDELRDDDRVSMSFYSDPNFFFDLWAKQMLADQGGSENAGDKKKRKRRRRRKVEAKIPKSVPVVSYEHLKHGKELQDNKSFSNGYSSVGGVQPPSNSQPNSHVSVEVPQMTKDIDELLDSVSLQSSSKKQPPRLPYDLSSNYIQPHSIGSPMPPPPPPIQHHASSPPLPPPINDHQPPRHYVDEEMIYAQGMQQHPLPPPVTPPVGYDHFGAGGEAPLPPFPSGYPGAFQLELGASMDNLPPPPFQMHQVPQSPLVPPPPPPPPPPPVPIMAPLSVEHKTVTSVAAAKVESNDGRYDLLSAIQKGIQLKNVKKDDNTGNYNCSTIKLTKQARKELDVQAIFEAAMRRRKRIEDSESEEDGDEDGWSSDED